MIEIDGSRGEGGGQVLRTSLALSVATGRAVHLRAVRAGRARPGLAAQHLAALRAAAAVGDAEVEGARLGSTEVAFRPRGVRPGRHLVSVGTAGSTGLVLQTVLPPLLTADGPSDLVLEGGTHNPSAPPFEFLNASFFPLLARLGPTVDAVLERPGFAPAGGGLVRVHVEPTPRLGALDLPERGRVLARRALAVVANLPVHIAEREIETLVRSLRASPLETDVATWPQAAGPGNVLLLEIRCEQVTAVFCGFGRLGVPAEAVARGVAREANRWLAAEVPVGEHLADQLLLPLALGAGGRYRTLPLTSHARTQIDLIPRFLDAPIVVEPLVGGAVEVRVG